MSIHLMLCAAKTRIKPSSKLVLLCLAESARDDGRQAWPGPEAMGEWANVSRARVFDCLRDLAELRLIEHAERGHRGRRGVYIVFPDGCCERHGPVGKESSGPDAMDPVDSPAHRTLSAGKRPVSEGKRPVSEAIASGGPDASLTPEPNYIQGFSPSLLSPRPLRSVPPDEDCEHGVDRHAGCAQCRAAKATA